MNNHDYHYGPEICTNCGGRNFEDTRCVDCGKFTGESQADFEAEEDNQ